MLSYTTDTPRTDDEQEAYLELQENLAAVRAQAITQSEQIVTLQRLFAEKYNFIIEDSFAPENTLEVVEGDGEGTAFEESLIQ